MDAAYTWTFTVSLLTPDISSNLEKGSKTWNIHSNIPYINWVIKPEWKTSKDMKEKIHEEHT